MAELEQARQDAERQAQVIHPAYADGLSTQPYETPVEKKTFQAAVAHAIPVHVLNLRARNKGRQANATLTSMLLKVLVHKFCALVTEGSQHFGTMKGLVLLAGGNIVHQLKNFCEKPVRIYCSRGQRKVQESSCLHAGHEALQPRNTSCHLN